MAIDPNIALQFRSPQVEQVSPLQSIATLMQLRGQMAEIPLRLAQAEHARQQAAQEAIITEQKNRQLQDESTLKEMMADPDAALKIAGGDTSPLNGRVQYDFQQAIAKNAVENIKNAALANKDDLENQHTALGGLAEALLPLQSETDPGAINAKLTAIRSNPANQLLFKNAKIDPNSIPTISDPKQLDQWETAVRLKQTVIDKALALKKEQAGISNTEAEANLRAAQTPGAAAESGIKQKELEFMQNATTNGADAAIDARIDPKEFPQQNAAAKAAWKLTLSSTGNPKDAAASVEKVAATIDEIRKQQAEIPGEVAKATAVARATNPIIQGRELTVAAANRQAAEHVTAQGEYEKSLEALNTSASDAVRIHNLIAAAQGGNKAAPAVVPIAELRTFITRPNIAELRSVGGAGSALDTIEGWVKGKTEGQPIPPDVLKATDELASLAVTQAEQKHAGSVKSINTARHESFKPATAADLGYGAPVPTPATQAEFNALPKGAKFKKPNDQTVYTKQ